MLKVEIILCYCFENVSVITLINTSNYKALVKLNDVIAKPTPNAITLF